MGHSVEAGYPYYPGVGRTGEDGCKGVYHQVMPKDISAEDLAERRFRRAFRILDWKLDVRDRTNSTPGKGWVGDLLDGVDYAGEDSFGPADDPIASDASVQYYYIEFGEFGKEAMRGTLDGTEEGEVEFFGV